MASGPEPGRGQTSPLAPAEGDANAGARRRIGRLGAFRLKPVTLFVTNTWALSPHG